MEDFEPHFEPDLEFADEEAAVDSVLGSDTRSDELKSLIAALEARRSALLREAESSSDPGERIQIEAKLGEIDMQLNVLREEEAIMSFVEKSVRVTLQRPPPIMDDEEE